MDSGGGTGRSRSARLWQASILLFLPALIPFLVHWLDRSAAAEPSGFIQPDQPYYAANAREHFDAGRFRLTYGLPFSPSEATPRIYFQPQILVLAMLLRTGLDPALASLLLGAVAGVAAIRVALALLDRLVGLDGPAQRLAALAFIWGGGLLVLAGVPGWLRSGDLDALFALDPAGGAWCLNLGRNFFLPMECWYHLLWLGAILQLVKRRPWSALGIAALLSISHPFTGLELACVLTAWMLLEAAWLRDPAIRLRHAAAAGGMLVAHLAYYLVFLPSFPEHASVADQWVRFAQGWTYEARSFVPAYAIVGGMAAWRLRTPERAAGILASPDARLFLVSAVTCFALANNEFALRPDVQPLHFTRGYTWLSLFLLGAPALVALFDRLLASARGRAAAALVVVVLLADNAAFLATFHARRATGAHELLLPPGFRELAAWMSRPEQRGSLVLAQPASPDVLYDPVPYLLTAYTPLRTWKSHAYNTPDVLRRKEELAAAFFDGAFLPEWGTRRLVVLVRADTLVPPWVAARGGREAFRADGFVAFVVEPVTSSP